MIEVCNLGRGSTSTGMRTHMHLDCPKFHAMSIPMRRASEESSRSYSILAPDLLNNIPTDYFGSGDSPCQQDLQPFKPVSEPFEEIWRTHLGSLPWYRVDSRTNRLFCAADFLPTKTNEQRRLGPGLRADEHAALDHLY